MGDEYKRLIEEIRDIYFIVQQERLALVSNYTAELYGYSKDELIGKPFLELVAPEERERLSKYFKLRTEGHQVPERYECVFLTKDGTRIPGEVSVWLTLFQEQPAIAGIIIDLTKRKLIMEKLQESEEKYRSIVENSPDIIYTADPEGVVHSVNGAVRHILGYAPEEIIGRKFMDFIPSQAMPRVMDNHDQLCSGDSVASKIMSVSKDGFERCLEFRSVPFFKDGVVVKAQGMIRDITDYMKSEEKLNRMFESMTDSVTVIDLEGFIVELNGKTVDIHGYSSKNDILGKNVLELVAECDKKEVQENIEKLINIETIRDIEYKLMRKDGSEFYGEISASVLRDAFGKPEGYISITRDITDRKQMEEKYKQLLEDMNDGYAVIQDGKYVFANSRFCNLLGFEAGQLNGESMDRFLKPENRQAMMEEYERVMRGYQPPAEKYAYEILREDGVIIILETNIRIIEYEGKPALGVIARDVTDSRKAEEAMRESSEMLHLMFDCAPYSITVMDLDTVIVDANEQAVKLCGFNSKSELVGRGGLEFLPKKQLNQAMKSITVCLNEGMLIDFEHTVQKDDSTKISAQTSAGVITNTDGIPSGLIAITRDITEEKQLRENKQSYIREIIKAQETERKSLARALHDDTVQELLLASHRLQDVIAGNKGRLPKRAQRHLGELRTLIENIMAEVRAFSVDLRPGVLDDMGLIPALRWLTKRLQEGGDIESGLTVQGKERRLPSETELSLFRITQESLSNVRKHAGASTARVTLQFDEKKVMLSVVDNGRGFELPPVVSQFARERKLGLAGIAERVSLLGGSCKFESSPGKGTAVRVEVDG